ncbi:MAG TPA: hypothetical protein VEC36_12090 [Patescibacteria group bacterium]|nr:hypothetical protein [Patescibacteria group bacterium]
MATFSIESNGLLESTAVYFNGQQISGIKEIFLNLDEEGTFDAIIQYLGSDNVLYTKQIFTDYLENLKTTEPSFTEEEAAGLQLFSIESEGGIDTAVVFLNEEQLEGVVSVLIHIKSGGNQNKGGIRSLFSKPQIPEHDEFKAEITYRNEDDSLETENIF